MIQRMRIDENVIIQCVHKATRDGDLFMSGMECVLKFKKRDVVRHDHLDHPKLSFSITDAVNAGII